MKIINLLEALKNDPKAKYQDFLDTTEFNSIMNWYNNQSSFDEQEIDKAINLLYWFYVHENLDLYDVSVFSQTVQSISCLHNINKDDVFNKYIEFKKLVY